MERFLRDGIFIFQSEICIYLFEQERVNFLFKISYGTISFDFRSFFLEDSHVNISI